MKTLAERVEWVLANTRRPDGGRWDAAALSHAASISAAHVGMIRRGDVQKPRGETIIAIAKAAGVSERWLLTGDGSPELADVMVEGHGLRAHPKFEALPNWSQLRDAAKALDPSLSEWALDEIAHSYPLATAPINPRQVVQLAKIAMELLTPPADVKHSKK